MRSVISTIIVQLVNTILFTLFAFLGVYDFAVLIDIMFASFGIFIVTSVWDMIIQIVAKKTCKTSNILFKGVE